MLPAAPSARLLLAGAAAAHYDVAAAIAAHSAADRVMLTGYLDSEDDELTDHIAACDVTLNLRWPTGARDIGSVAARARRRPADRHHGPRPPRRTCRRWIRGRGGRNGTGDPASASRSASWTRIMGYGWLCGASERTRRIPRVARPCGRRPGGLAITSVATDGTTTMQRVMEAARRARRRLRGGSGARLTVRSTCDDARGAGSQRRVGSQRQRTDPDALFRRLRTRGAMGRISTLLGCESRLPIEMTIT